MKLQIEWRFYDPEQDTGWVFSRLEDGSVKIEHRDIDEHHNATLTLPAEDWKDLLRKLAV